MKRWISFVLCSALLLNPFVSAWSQTQSGARFKIYADLVLVDVRVDDRHGNPVQNLEKKDFHVYEDGVEQSLAVFRYQDVTRTEVAAKPETPATPLPPAPAAEKKPPVPLGQSDDSQYSDRRLIVMMFDLSSLDASDALYARKTAEDYLKTKIAPADLVAVVVMAASLRVVQDFTDDKKLLEAALNKIKLGQSTDLSAQGLTDPTANDNTGTVENTNEDTSDPFAVDDTQFNIFNTDRKLVAIESVAKMLQDLPERKSLIHFSSGITTTGVENDAQVKATVYAANRANMSIYAVDSRGLVATPAGGDASRGGTGGTAMFSGASIRSGLDQISSAQDTLVTLSEDTGGRAFIDTNDLGQVFDQVHEDTRSYYLVGYYSSNTKHDGRFRRIKVTVDVPDVKLQFRQGYIAPKEFGQLTKDELNRQLEEALNTDAPFTDLPFILGAYSFEVPDPKDPKTTEMFVPVSLRLPSSDVPFTDKRDRKETNFDFVGAVQDPARANTMVSYVRDTIHLKLDDALYARIAAGGSIQYDTGFFLRPGNYKLKFLIRENQTGKIGTFEQALVVPDLSKQAFKMSSVVLSSQLQPIDKMQVGVTRTNDRDALLQRQDKIPNPLVQNQQKIVPNVGHVFSARQTLYSFFQVYQPAVDPQTKKPHIDLAVLFFKDGKKVFQSPEYEVDQFNADSLTTVDCNFTTPLTQFARGRYLMQLVVTDQIAGTHAYKRIPFVVK
ncbi:MAG: VWA domain-containing protein [Acidobacteriia bacterium]|nr:VWA domain-containing protein [Terriglobia bacterium]